MRGTLDIPEVRSDERPRQVVRVASSVTGILPPSDADVVHRIPALDGVRGMAILLVLFFHLNLLRSLALNNPVDEFASKVFTAGWCGVDLFFVLSGYLITRILYQAKESEGYFRNFYFRRILRIFPLYYGLLIVTFVVIPNLPAGLIPAEKLERWTRVETNPLWFWFYLNNFATAIAGSWGHGILDVTWSLAIEEQFYVLWPLVVFKLNRDRLLQTCLFVFVTAFIIRSIMTIWGMNSISTYVFTLGRFDVIAAGAFVALAAEGPGGIQRLLPARRIWVITAIALLGLFVWRGGMYNMDPVILTIGLSLVAMNFSALLAVVVSLPPGHWLVRVFSMRFLRAFGKYSYAMYLIHVPLSALVRDTLYSPNHFFSLFGSRLPGQMLFYVLTTMLIFTIAFASWHLWEKHFLKLKPSTALRPVEVSL
jgi:peptidoglycan/LPS O-acetylase OafA/YrhL